MKTRLQKAVDVFKTSNSIFDDNDKMALGISKKLVPTKAIIRYELTGNGTVKLLDLLTNRTKGVCDFNAKQLDVDAVFDKVSFKAVTAATGTAPTAVKYSTKSADIAAELINSTLIITHDGKEALKAEIGSLIVDGTPNQPSINISPDFDAPVQIKKKADTDIDLDIISPLAPGAGNSYFIEIKLEGFALATR